MKGHQQGFMDLKAMNGIFKFTSNKKKKGIKFIYLKGNGFVQRPWSASICARSER